MADTVGRRSTLGSLTQVPTRSETSGLLVAFGILSLLVAGDAVAGASAIITGTYVAAPFAAAILASTRATAVVALAAALAAGLSALWNENFGTLDYDLRLLTVSAVGVLAVFSARLLERGRRNSERLELLESVGAIATGSLPLDETIRRVTEIVVPAIADFCMVDALRGGRLHRIAVRAHGRGDAPEVERYLQARTPTVPDVVIAPEAGQAPRGNLWAEMPEPVLREMAHDERDLEGLQRLAPRSAISAPMIARGGAIGALTIGVAWSGRRYREEDRRLAEILAGRVALALDNAGLFSDLESAERRLDTVMSIVDQAVVLHDPSGEVLYANRAAGEMLGFATTEQAVAMPLETLGERLRIRDESGREVGPAALVRAAGPGEDSSERVLRALDAEGRDERWYLSRTKPIAGPDGSALHSVTVVEDVTDVKRAELGARLLARLAELLDAASGPDEALSALTAVAAPALADRCEIHPAPSRPEGMPVGGEPVLHSGGPGEESRVLVPLAAGGSEFGVIELVNGPGSRNLDEIDLNLALEMARRGGLAIERSRLSEERAEVARTLQRGLLPSALPQMRGWEAAAMYRPAGEVNEVGGDFYDVFPVGDEWMVAVGDVIGRGAAAASLTALARHTIRTAGMLTQDPAVALEMLHRELSERPGQALCTVALALLPDTVAGGPATVRLVSAGHPLPLRLRDGRAEEVGAPGPLLGAFESPSWEVVEVETLPGDQLAIYTDGITEARGRSDRFGDGRLHASLVGAASASEAVALIERALDSYIPGDPEDDAALLVVDRNPVASRPQLERAPSPPRRIPARSVSAP